MGGKKSKKEEASILDSSESSDAFGSESDSSDKKSEVLNDTPKTGGYKLYYKEHTLKNGEKRIYSVKKYVKGTPWGKKPTPLSEVKNLIITLADEDLMKVKKYIIKLKESKNSDK